MSPPEREVDERHRRAEHADSEKRAQARNERRPPMARRAEPREHPPMGVPKTNPWRRKR